VAEVQPEQVICRPRYRGKPDIGSTRHRYIVILHTHRERHRVFLDATSVYSDIDRDIGTISGMISVKTPISGVARNGYVTILTRYHIGCGKERVCHDIDPISCPISGKNTISGTI